MSETLSIRQRKILALVVQDYVERAQPVGSLALVRGHGLTVSPATVRNELAALEEMGFLAQPHTSAGRVPTVAGYRYFVEHLMQRAEIPHRERETIRHQFHQAGWDLERWLKLSAAVMARVSGVAALVASGGERRAPLLRVELVDLGGGNVQVIGILDNGRVRQLRWRPEQAFDQEALDQAGSRVNAWIAGRDASFPMLVGIDEASAIERGALEAVNTLAKRSDAPSSPQLYHAGLTQILTAPEFADSARLRELVELLEHGQGLERILHQLPQSGVQVIIGGEPPLEQLPYMTLVLSRYGAPSGEGVLGVVGPTRMAYERAVPTVGFMARLMTRLVAGEVV
jgi:heat-inducible transcriptional repressor